MRHLDDPELAQYLIKTEWVKQQIGKYNDRWNAVMVVPCGVFKLRVIASRGGGWDHVSVSLAERTPTWAEMEFIRKLLFLHDEVVVQFHVPETHHINIHPNTLHMWRPFGKPYKLPPSTMV